VQSIEKQGAVIVLRRPLEQPEEGLNLLESPIAARTMTASLNSIRESLWIVYFSQSLRQGMNEPL
jgi:5-enolpyruvylshikimate-3-phosphate synthase